MSVPKLRFPEFWDVGEWGKRTFSDMLSEHRCKSTGMEEVFSVSVHKGLVNQIEHLGRSFSASSTDHYNRVHPGDIVYTKSPTGNFPLGIIKQSKLNFSVIVSPLYGVFSPETIALGTILEAYFESPANTKIYLDPLVQKGAKNTINIRNSKFLSGALILPENKEEQKKIADCLSSIADRITAETQKLDTLKAHKKGLMQQLFPTEGETLPKLRFPEFRDSEEWEETHLGEIIEVASGQVDPTEPPYCDLPHIGGENIESHTGNLHAVKTARELRLISGKYLFNEGDVLYSKIRPALNKVAIPDFKGICSADIYPLRPSDDKLCRRYLAYLLLSERFLEYATKHSERSKIPKINRDSLLAYKVVIPHRPEQQRIADCLTSLEDLIAAQKQAIDLLKLHKKGLMQQLFPSVEDVRG